MLHWKFRDALKDMHKQDGTVEVLVELICRANIRWRCWPGMDLISNETGCAISVVTKAKKWLLKHKAIYLVPYAQRIGKELELPPRQHVYQLTGVIELADKTVQYLNMSDESWHEIQDEVDNILAATDNVSQDEVSPDEVSSHETKGITSIEDDPSLSNTPNDIASRRLKHRSTSPSLGPTNTEAKETTPREPLSALEEYLARTANVKKRTIAFALAQRLTQDRYIGKERILAPAMLFDTSKVYQAFVDAKIAYWRTLDKPEMSHLVNLVCQLYDAHGWLAYYDEHGDDDIDVTQADDNDAPSVYL